MVEVLRYQIRDAKAAYDREFNRLAKIDAMAQAKPAIAETPLYKAMELQVIDLNAELQYLRLQYAQALRKSFHGQ